MKYVDAMTAASDISSAIQELAGNQWLCLFCQKICTTKANVRKHIKIVHLKEKKYACDKCGEKFGQKSGVTQHSRICSKN